MFHTCEHPLRLGPGQVGSTETAVAAERSGDEAAHVQFFEVILPVSMVQGRWAVQQVWTECSPLMPPGPALLQAHCSRFRLLAQHPSITGYFVRPGKKSK